MAAGNCDLASHVIQIDRHKDKTAVLERFVVARIHQSPVRLRYSMPMQHASLMQRLIGNHMHSLRIIEKKTIFLEEQQDGGINNNRMFLWSGVALLPFATHS